MEAALVVDVGHEALVVLATERVERRQRVEFRPRITMTEAHAGQAPLPTDLLDEAVDGAVADRRVADLGDAGPQRTVRELRELLPRVYELDELKLLDLEDATVEIAVRIGLNYGEPEAPIRDSEVSARVHVTCPTIVNPCGSG